MTPRARAINATARYLKSTARPELTKAALAQAARLDETELGALFPSLDVLLAAAMARLFKETDATFFSDDAARGWSGLANYVELLRGLESKGAMVALFVRLRVEAADPEHPSHEVNVELRERNLVVLEHLLNTGIEDGEISPELDVQFTAKTVLSLVEGSQAVDLALEEGFVSADAVANYFELLRFKYGR